MVKKFKRQQQIVEAIRYNNLNKSDVELFLGVKVHQELESETAYLAGQAPPIFSLNFETRRGIFKVKRGEWIVKDLVGDEECLKFCSNSNFQSSYEEVSEFYDEPESKI